MDLTSIGAYGLGVMVLLIVVGVPVAFSLASVAIVGLLIVSGPMVTLQQATLTARQVGMDFVLICIPLFVFMGKLAHHAGIAAKLYDAIQKWVGRLPGGMAIAAVLSCAAFGAVTGSSVASVATMGSIIRPQLKKYNYDDTLSTGTLAASGSLAILIPPSVGFAFYGILTETSIAALFIAGIVPGIMLTTFYVCGVFARCAINPKLGPRSTVVYSMAEKVKAFRDTWPILAIFMLVIGGIYFGWFTPTEASGVGAVGVLVVGLLLRAVTWPKLREALLETGLITAMIYGIIVAGYILSRFLAVTGLSEALVKFVIGLQLGHYTFILMLVLIYVVLGSLLDVFGILILTIPFFFPLVRSYGIDPVWFGVFSVIMCEVGLLTPPVGVNVFVMHAVAPEVPMKKIFRGIILFTMFDFFMIFLITVFPDIALWLTRH